MVVAAIASGSDRKAVLINTSGAQRFGGSKIFDFQLDNGKPSGIE